MSVNIESGKELLKRAIKGEVDGLRFYTYLVEKVDNEDARRKLSTLASDEKRHKATLIDAYRKLYKEDVGELPEQGINALAKFFDTKKAKGKTTEMEFIDLAIEAELAASHFYKEQAQELEDSELKTLYADLSEEEFSHYESLMAEKEALSGNYHWFSLDEGAPMEM